MNWEFAIEKNLEALRRILAMLVAMAGMTGGEGADQGSGGGRKTLPRHLRRLVLRLLRPAESATRRLIIVAAGGLSVKVPRFREAKPRPKKPPEIIYVLDRIDGRMVSVPMVVPEPPPSPELPRQAASLPPRGRPLSLLDPMKRFDTRRRYAKASAMPQIRLLGGDPIVPFFRRPEPLPPPPPTPDDLLDAGNIHRRLGAIGHVLEDLPKHALRMARWQARRDARLALTKKGLDAGESNLPPPLTPPHKGEGDLPHAIGSGTPEGFRQAEPPRSPPPPCGEGLGVGVHAPTPARLGAGVSLEELGLTPEAIALCARTRSGRAQPNTAAQTPKPRRFHRLFPMRPGRPPGWRRKPNHDVYEVLNELHGLAVWASERRDSS